VAVLVLLAVAGSGEVVVTLAVFETVRAGPTIVTLIVTFADPAAGTVPRFAVTVEPEARQLPWVVVQDTKFTPGGRLSVTTVPAAGEPPVFVMARPYATAVEPARETVFGLLVFVIARSAGATGATTHGVM
jgi:hypothetical protein